MWDVILRHPMTYIFLAYAAVIVAINLYLTWSRRKSGSRQVLSRREVLSRVSDRAAMLKDVFADTSFRANRQETCQR